MPIINHPLCLTMLACSCFFAMNVQAADGAVSCVAIENTAIIATTEHLTDNTNGIIIDPETGLIWKKCSEGQIWSNNADNNCTGTAATYTWQEALQRAQAVNTGSGENFSQTGWRLPNIKELAAIAELRCNNPIINETFFPQTPTNNFWSSSPSAAGSTSAWSVSFINGIDSISNKSDGNRVRLVRSGQ